MKENVFNKEAFIEDVKEKLSRINDILAMSSENITAGDFSGSFLHGKRCHY